MKLLFDLRIFSFPEHKYISYAFYTFIEISFRVLHCLPYIIYLLTCILFDFTHLLFILFESISFFLHSCWIHLAAYSYSTFIDVLLHIFIHFINCSLLYDCWAFEESYSPAISYFLCLVFEIYTSVLN
jgi:hypothetical protein